MILEDGSEVDGPEGMLQCQSCGEYYHEDDYDGCPACGSSWAIPASDV